MEIAETAEETSLHVSRRAGFSKVWIALSAFVCCLVLLAAAVELLSFAALSSIAFLHRHDDEAPMEHPYYQKMAWWKDYWKEWAVSNQMQYLPYVIWRRAPYTGKYINIDAAGLRRTVNPNCAPGATRIWMFGDSTLWGSGSRDENTIPSILAAEYARTIGPVCVTNFGESGWVNTQEVIQLELALKQAPAPPDLVIFYDGFADAFMHYQSDMVDSHQNFEHIRTLMEAHKQKHSNFEYIKQTNTYRFINYVTGRFASLKGESSPAASLPQLDQRAQTAARNYVMNMKLVQALSQRYGFQYVAFWTPAISLGHKPLTAHEKELRLSMDKTMPGMAQLLQTTNSQVFSAGDPHMINLSDLFDGVDRDLYLDSAHVTEEGNGLVAVRILEELKKSGTVSKLGRGTQ